MGLLHFGYLLSVLSVVHLVIKCDIYIANHVLPYEIREEMANTNTTSLPPTPVFPVADGNTVQRNSNNDDGDNIVVWFGQGPAKNAELWKKRLNGLPNARLFYHSYDEPCDICIYKAKTDFAEGRNLALLHALKTIDPNHIKYFVSFDSDLTMTHCTEADEENPPGGLRLGREDRCWRGFHKMLSRRETQHALVTPKTWWDPAGEATNYQTCAENAVNAFRGVDMLKMIYPLSYVNIQKDWTYNTHVGWHLMNKCLPTTFLSDERFVLSNPAHAAYPMEHNPQHVFEILNEDFAEVGPWEPPLLWHRCSVSSSRVPVDDTAVWSQCKPMFDRRFQSWLGTHESSIIH